MEATQPSAAVVVGFDGSPGARTALEWAVAEAERRHAPLDVVVAAHVPGMPHAPGVGSIVPGTLDALTKERVAEAIKLVQKVRSTLSDDDFIVRSVVGAPVEVLEQASERAALCVVGSEGHGPVARAFLGSVAGGLVTSAACPVVVVRGDVRDDRPVVVGVDGSRVSDAAVDLAAAAAQARGVPLVVLCAWALPAMAYGNYPRWREDLVDDWTREYQAEAASTASRAAERVAKTWPELDVRVQAPATPPVLALREASKDAGLLVVGSRRLGRLSRFVLGSVSHDIVQTASCPVAVCRP
jgi:nucleotide-binding universal stress UspA family protein